TAFHYEPERPWTELRMEAIPHRALAKAIVLREISPARVREVLSAVLTFLTDDLYPLGEGNMSGPDVFRKFHGNRLADSIGLLNQHPQLRGLINAPGVQINGNACPSVRDACRWLDDHAATYFKGSRLVRGHGDGHMDNILVSLDGEPEFFMIDPRGDL